MRSNIHVFRQVSVQRQTPPQPAFDIARFNEAARSFFEHWQPPPSDGPGRMPVRKILMRFDFSKGGFLVAHYADPATRGIEVWGLDVASFRSGRLTPLRLRA